MPHGIFEVTYIVKNLFDTYTEYLFFVLLTCGLYDVCRQYILSEHYNPVGAPVTRINYNNTTTYLGVATGHNDVKLIEAIVSRGNYFNNKVTHNEKQRVLKALCSLELKDIVMKLVQSDDYKELDEIVVSKDYYGESVLKVADQKKLVDAYKFMVRRLLFDLKVTNFDGGYGNNIFFDLLTESRYYDIVEEFLDSKQELPRVRSHHTGNNIQMAIIGTKNDILIKKLRLREVTAEDLKNMDNKDNNLLFGALSAGLEDYATDMMQCVTAKHILVNKDGHTPVCYAVKHKMTKLTDRLVDLVDKAYQGLELNAITYRKLTVAMLDNAVKMVNNEHIQMLLTKFNYEQSDVLAAYNRCNVASKKIFVALMTQPPPDGSVVALLAQSQ
jgi:hypothetical protein